MRLEAKGPRHEAKKENKALGRWRVAPALFGGEGMAGHRRGP